jgi:hypothetical protein
VRSASDLPSRRAELIDAHAELSENHSRLREEPNALVAQREHRDALMEHRDALAEFQQEVEAGPEPLRQRLQIPKAREATEQMLGETLATIEQSRQAWKRATDTWQRVREQLDK